MENHYHILLKTIDPNLSKAMQWIGTTYTRRFNLRHGESGHLFQRQMGTVTMIDNFISATMASADACPLTRRITSSSAAQNHSLSVHLYFVSHSVAELSIVCAGTFGYRWPLPSVSNLCYAKSHNTGIHTGNFTPIRSRPCRAHTKLCN
jgi:hypothetical protein